MIPFPIYLTSIQANLQVGFTDFKREVALFVNWGADSSLWTGDQDAELERDVQEAYRWCLYPQRLPDERTPHTWTFLEQTTTLDTTSGTYNYTQPVDFGSFIGQYMFYPAESGYGPLCRTDDGTILHKRSYAIATGRPTHFALRWLAQTSGSGQRQEVILWPTPDASYTLTYRYAVQTGPISESNPYPLGGPRMGQLMIEACKAVGEMKKNGTRGDQWNLFIAQMQSTISLDKATNTPTTVGMMRGAPSGRYLLDRGSSNYYFGPDSSGAYTLEVV